MSSIKTRYEIKKQLGDGAFGSVFLALSRESKEVVAIKQMKQKYMKWEDCLALREVKALKKLSSHPNIVKLKEVLRDSDGTLAFVFEFMDGNLFQLITDRQGIRFQESKAKSIIHQILKGLSYMHSKGFFHRFFILT